MMDAYFRLSKKDRRQYCEAAAVELGIAAASVEKDFWMTWALRELFSLPKWGPNLTFKGGTSLSKGWKLIQRFSEDIDVVIDREFLGFGGETLTRGRINKLRNACAVSIQEHLAPALNSWFADRLSGERDWSIAGGDSEPETLLFRYPTVFETEERYLRREVKIELGARSETVPNETPAIQPMLADWRPDLFPDSVFAVRTVTPQRTFWDKVLLLHECNCRPQKEESTTRMSRHYYDLLCLIRRGVAAQARATPGLFDQVLAHRRQYFRTSGIDYDACKPGGLTLVPPPEHLGAWRRDYDLMRGVMIYGESPPTFEELMEAAKKFESEFNGG